MDTDTSSPVKIKRPFFSFFSMAIIMRSQNWPKIKKECTTPTISSFRPPQRSPRLFIARLAAISILRFCSHFYFSDEADEEMAAKKSSGGGGGIKGFLTRAGSSFYAGGLYAREKGAWLAQKAGRIGFIIATTSIVTLMPLIFEITREGQVCSHAVCLQRLGSVLFLPAIFVDNNLSSVFIN